MKDISFKAPVSSFLYLTILICIAHDRWRALSSRVQIAHKTVVAYFVAYRARVAAHA